MNKYTLLLLIAFLFLLSCMPVENGDDITNDFYLTDTTGFEINIFSSGDSFFMQFYYVNTTADTIDYTVSDSRPAVVFYIEEDGDRIASSIDGYGFYEAIMNYQLAPGDTLKGEWLAPTTPAQDTLITLDAGQYTASVEFQGSPEIDFPCVTEIIFNVNE